MSITDDTKFYLRGKLKEEGIYKMLNRLFEQRTRPSKLPGIMKLGLINLFENKPTLDQVLSWEKMLNNVNEFENYLNPNCKDKLKDG